MRAGAELEAADGRPGRRLPAQDAQVASAVQGLVETMGAGADFKAADGRRGHRFLADHNDERMPMAMHTATAEPGCGSVGVSLLSLAARLEAYAAVLVLPPAGHVALALPLQQAVGRDFVPGAP